ncbi:MAG: hypothetical protein WDM70_01505 [Nitrosomonadales bacterium]
MSLNDYKGAMVCFLRAQEENNSQIYKDSCSQIAMMYELGWGAEKDEKASKYWLQKVGL